MVHNLDVEQKRKKQKVASTNTTGYTGTTKRASGKFVALIRIAGKKTGLGTFDTAIAAALAYDQAAIKRGSKSHTLNFPDGLPIINEPSNHHHHQKKKKNRRRRKRRMK